MLWRSDLAVGNFFRVTCPYLFELDTVAYFGLIRREHTFATLAMIRDTATVARRLSDRRRDLR